MHAGGPLRGKVVDGVERHFYHFIFLSIRWHPNSPHLPGAGLN